MGKSTLDVGKLILAGGIGILDMYAEKLDADAMPVRTEVFKRYKDYLRIVAFAGGLAAQVWMPKHARWGEAASLAAVPLVMRSINDSIGVIRPKLASQAGRSLTPVNRSTPTPVSQRYPAPEPQNEFKNIRL